MEPDIQQESFDLQTRDKTHLSKLWAEHFGKPAPPHLRKQLMVSLLAYRMQEKKYGGLSHTARQELRTLAAELSSEGPAKSRIETVQPPGTRLLRSWHGEMHEVDVVDGGFAYRDRTYRSLSSIATEITGTRWSGPSFFGLKKDEK